MGARLPSPSLVDEFVCDTADGTDFLTASNQFVGKIANKFRSDINILFTYRNNIALMMQKVPDGVPNGTQAKDLKHHTTRANLAPCKLG